MGRGSTAAAVRGGGTSFRLIPISLKISPFFLPFPSPFSPSTRKVSVERCDLVNNTVVFTSTSTSKFKTLCAFAFAFAFAFAIPILSQSSNPLLTQTTHFPTRSCGREIPFVGFRIGGEVLVVVWLVRWGAQREWRVRAGGQREVREKASCEH